MIFFFLKLVLFSFGLSVLLTTLWIYLAGQFNWRDQNIDRIPVEEMKNVQQRPLTSGGLMIYLSCWITFLIFKPELMRSPYYNGIFISSTFVIITGLIDDRWNLNGIQKSIAIIIAASIIYFRSNIVFHTTLISFDVWGLNYLLTVGWIFLVTNAINLLDGIDGLATSVTLVSFTVLAIVVTYFSVSVSIILLAGLLILIGALLGFLPFNWYPAKLYLGDTGALFLGFMYGVLSVTRLKNATFYTLIIPILIFMVPLFDTFYATMRRIILGKSIVVADQDHLHHRLLNKGLSVPQVVIVMTSISVVFGIFAVLTQWLHKYRQIILLLSFFMVILMFFLMKYLKRRKK